MAKTMTTAEAELVRAIACCEDAMGACRNALAALKGTPPEPPAPTGKTDLSTFAWAGKKTRDPTGLLAGYTYGERMEKGKVYCQWHWVNWIIIATVPVGTKSCTGTSKECRWYHFTRTKEPWELLSNYFWKNTHLSEGWYRWAKG
jgi:hypothetical protein